MIHLIGNAHLDPAWMWPLEEGLEAFAATCQSALDRIEEYPDLIFTCSSAAHYEYVEQTDPILFERIRSAVENGTWCIVGGWWVEADCNLPSGESLIRQALLGQRYLRSRFGRIATVGYNIDSFGHNANLPAILRSAGIRSYVFMRPEEHESPLPDALFEWRAPSGASVTAYRLPLHYSNFKDAVSAKLELLPKYPLYKAGRDWMLFFGVGNHGGGPTIEQLEMIRSLQSQRTDLQLSDPEQFFASVQPTLTLNREMNPHAIGAYSANARIKQLNRRAENALDRAERMQVMRVQCLPAFELTDLEQAWKDLCLTQFHDLIGGVSIKEATEEVLALQAEAIAIAERSARLDRQRIASHVDTNRAIQNLVVFNDSSYDRTEYIKFELWHPHASEKGEILEALTLESSGGHRIACQKIEASGKIGEDRVRWLARVQVPSFGWNTFAVHTHEALVSAPAELPELIEPSLLVAHDDADTWAHGLRSYLPPIGRFEEHARHEVEMGPLRSLTRVSREYASSSAEIEYLRYAGEDYIELRVMLDWHEPNETVLLAIPHGVSDPSVRYEIPYAWIDRPADGSEYPGQTWLDVRDASGAGIALINDSKYSFNVDETYIYVTLVRSKPYAYHAPPHVLIERERVRYLDHGVQECRFYLLRDASQVNVSLLSHLSERLNKPLAIHHESQHRGDLPSTNSLMRAEPVSVRIGAVKPAEDGRGVILRAVELEGRERVLHVTGKLAEMTVQLSPFAIQGYRVTSSDVFKVDSLECSE